LGEKRYQGMKKKIGGKGGGISLGWVNRGNPKR